MKQVYKITYPNGKIYVGMDLTGTTLYLGSADKELIARDLGLDGVATYDITLRKEVLWQSANASDAEVRAKEVEMIKREGSQDPNIGYNRWPKWTSPAVQPLSGRSDRPIHQRDVE